ncbi:MAG: glycoside hydrolase family 30 beta sandwich domain-containing protein [Gracilimonas sp.]|nr:glycoside hydrolase family 30 beta sandwich domain-containing protein [Gracilimonas sp.]
MKFKILLFSVLISGLFIFSQSCKTVDENGKQSSILWLTTADEMALLEKIEGRVTESDISGDLPTIDVNTSITYQTIDGFGYTLTGGSAMLINDMSASNRQELLEELFGRDDGQIGVSYLRLSIGSSDLDPHTFSYNDLPPGETDTDMSEFSLDPDREYLIPILKEILSISPDLKIMGSPWSAPTWMKTNKNTVGGSLLPEYYDAYALYFVKYIQGMADEGITIDAITVQNEPHHDGNNPSMYMEAIDQANFIKNHLGPAFEEAGIETKIIIWDHNADNPQYPISILNDPEAKKYIDGSAFHLYAGDISALSRVHNAHPDKNLYFTEQWIGAPGNFSQDLAWHMRNLIIGATRNWSRNVLEWNLAADPNQDPHTEGGCTECLGALTIDRDQITRNPGYYIVAHASKFVLPGAVRIESNIPEGLPNVAFKNEDGQIVIIILNDSDSTKQVVISVDGEEKKLSLFRGAVGTVIW